MFDGDIKNHLNGKKKSVKILKLKFAKNTEDITVKIVSPPSSNEYGQMVREYRPKRKMVGKIVREYMAPFINILYLKKWVCKASNLVKKATFARQRAAPPPPHHEYEQMVKKYRPIRENCQRIYGSLYKLCLPKKWVYKASNFGKKSKLLEDTEHSPSWIWANGQGISNQKGKWSGNIWLHVTTLST